MFSDRSKQPTPGGSLELIASLIETAGRHLERSENELSFAGTAGTTTRIQAWLQNHRAEDGAIVNAIIRIETDLPELPLARGERWSDLIKDDRFIACLNMFSALSALVRDDKTGTFKLVSRVSVYEGDQKGWRFYVGLIAFGALLHVTAFRQGVADLYKIQIPPEAGTVTIPAVKEQCRWTGEDFAGAQQVMEQMGVCANASEDGLTAEFPWDPGAWSATMTFVTGERKRTSLLRMSAKERHPALGNGLFCRLELPLSLPDEKAAELACRLNLAEYRAIDSPPFFGAWCCPFGKDHPTYVCFLPNFLHDSRTAATLATWMLHRSQQVRM